MISKISLKGWLIIGVIIFICGYSYFRLDNLLRGPKLTVETPGNGADISEPLVTISGHAKRISKITLNGYPIFTNETGYFKESLLLSPGYNILVLAAEDRFKREVSETLYLTHHPAPTAPVASTTNYL